ncbi:MAG: hypothetical protein JSV32_00055, partial [Dehalococcoidia bacterium]
LTLYPSKSSKKKCAMLRTIKEINKKIRPGKMAIATSLKQWLQYGKFLLPELGAAIRDAGSDNG